MPKRSKSNVIPFPTRPRATASPRLGVWACSCGSLMFYLYSDGSVQCADCLEESQRMKCSADVSDSE
ncbi:MAG TPA: hypothetical protein VLI71_10290 [Gammaproteobacteria bacterium]|nr:hypothetical protein [Gammaproteobacteria bacterium]